MAGRQAALAFIFVTVVLDILALGIVIPVLPHLVEDFMGGDTAGAAKVYGLFDTVWALMQFISMPVVGALSDRFGRRRVILLSNLGVGLDYVLMALAPNLAWLFVSPGLDNVLAHYAIERLDRTESIDFRWSVLDIVPTSEHSRQLYWAFSLEGIMLRHFGYPSRRLENGKILELPPRAEPEMFTFKGPIGTTEVAGLPAESLHWAHKYYPQISNITFKEALGVDFNKMCSFLAGFGFNKTEPINVNAQMISPWEVLKFLANNQPIETKLGPDIRHGGGAIVRGVKDGQKVEYNIQQWPSESLVQKHKHMGCARFGGPGGTFRNGSPMGTMAVLMARGRIKEIGVFGPGVVEPPEEFIKQEVAMGQNVEITKTIRTHGKNTRQSDFLLFATGEGKSLPLAKVEYFQKLERLVCTFKNLLTRDAEVFQTKGNFIQHLRAKDLPLGVLKGLFQSSVRSVRVSKLQYSRQIPLQCRSSRLCRNVVQAR